MLKKTKEELLDLANRKISDILYCLDRNDLINFLIEEIKTDISESDNAIQDEIDFNKYINSEFGSKQKSLKTRTNKEFKECLSNIKNNKKHQIIILNALQKISSEMKNLKNI